MTHRRWFLPETPDIVGLLRRQVATTVDGLDALAAWAAGDGDAAAALAEAELRGETVRRELLGALRAAFVLPLEPEDAFTLSRGIDRILHQANDLVKEADAMAAPRGDAGIAAMAAGLSEAVGHVGDAIGNLGPHPGAATRDADAAIEAERRVQDAYYRGMAALLEVDDMRERIARRELYRRCSRIGDLVVDVGERVIYAVVKQS